MEKTMLDIQNQLFEDRISAIEVDLKRVTLTMF